jgi:hypothetical protein
MPEAETSYFAALFCIAQRSSLQRNLTNLKIFCGFLCGIFLRCQLRLTRLYCVGKLHFAGIDCRYIPLTTAFCCNLKRSA